MGCLKIITSNRIEKLFSKFVSTTVTVKYTASFCYTSAINETIRTQPNTHRLQPPAVSPFDPVEIYCQQTVEMWLISDSDEVVSQYNVFDLLWEAYGKAATAGNALEGFRAAGLLSAHRQFFTECDFAPREVLRLSENPDREDSAEDASEECTVQLKKLICCCIIHTFLC